MAISFSELIARHLSVPLEVPISAADVVMAIQAGSLDAVPPAAREVVATMFGETQLNTLSMAVYETGSSLTRMNELYLSCLAAGGHRSVEWERYYEELHA